MWEWRDGPPIEGQERTREGAVSGLPGLICLLFFAGKGKGPEVRNLVRFDTELALEVDLGTAVEYSHSYIPSLAEIQDWIPDPWDFPIKQSEFQPQQETGAT